MDWKQKAALDEQAPHALKVPSGNKIRLTYPPDGEGLPILAVRLQELFGLQETPPHCRWTRSGFAAPARAELSPHSDHHRPEKFLEWRVSGGAQGTPRALPQAPLAGRSVERPPSFGGASSAPGRLILQTCYTIPVPHLVSCRRVGVGAAIFPLWSAAA